MARQHGVFNLGAFARYEIPLTAVKKQLGPSRIRTLGLSAPLPSSCGGANACAAATAATATYIKLGAKRPCLVLYCTYKEVGTCGIGPVTCELLGTYFIQLRLSSTSTSTRIGLDSNHNHKPQPSQSIRAFGSDLFCSVPPSSFSPLFLLFHLVYSFFSSP
jgi:hypothetical protein